MKSVRALSVRMMAVAMCLWPSRAPAQGGPVPPCGLETIPAYPALGATSTERLWRRADVAKDWSLPACIGTTMLQFSTLVTTAARFRYTGGSDSLLRRIGAISELAGLLYWSPSHNKWQPLIVSASALAGPAEKAPRADFTPDEIRGGSAVYFQQADNLLGNAVFRIRVVESSADRIVFSVDNVNPMRYMFFTIFEAGGMQTIHFLDRESPSVWRYYGIARTGAHTNGMITSAPSSLINRAVAFFRFYAFIPGNQEPPGAPSK